MKVEEQKEGLLHGEYRGRRGGGEKRRCRAEEEEGEKAGEEIKGEKNVK